MFLLPSSLGGTWDRGGRIRLLRSDVCFHLPPFSSLLKRAGRPPASPRFAAAAFSLLLLPRDGIPFLPAMPVCTPLRPSRRWKRGRKKRRRRRRRRRRQSIKKRQKRRLEKRLACLAEVRAWKGGGKSGAWRRHGNKRRGERGGTPLVPGLFLSPPPPPSIPSARFIAPPSTPLLVVEWSNFCRRRRTLTGFKRRYDDSFPNCGCFEKVYRMF